MIPSLGQKFGVTVEVISKPRGEYASKAYSELGLPLAPAIMVGEQVLVQKSDISQEELESVLRRHLGKA